jgi:hypothetical protein
MYNIFMNTNSEIISDNCCIEETNQAQKLVFNLAPGPWTEIGKCWFFGREENRKTAVQDPVKFLQFTDATCNYLQIPKQPTVRHLEDQIL